MPKIGAYLIKILQFPVSYLLYASKTHFEDLHKALRNVPAVIIYLLQPEKRVGNFTFTFKPSPLLSHST